jgi:hypothetical protein
LGSLTLAAKSARYGALFIDVALSFGEIIIVGHPESLTRTREGGFLWHGGVPEARRIAANIAKLLELPRR